MTKTKKNILDLIGNTPLLEIANYNKKYAPSATILVKIESFNPGGSAKDRIAKALIEDAENKGILKEGSVIIEPTSGNTGIGLALVAAAKGYKTIITMPESMSIERRNLMKAYGAELVLTEASRGMAGAVEKAEELAKATPNSFIPGQFTNPQNPKAHYDTTGPEIWADTNGKVDIFVAGVGTGGTISGVGKYLKEKNKDIKIIAVEPSDSPLLSTGKAGSHKIQGIGANFIPETLDQKVYDQVITAEAAESFAAVKNLVKTEGLLVGISSGAALSIATKVANDPKNKNKTIIAFLPDGGEKYLSTPGFVD